MSEKADAEKDRRDVQESVNAATALGDSKHQNDTTKFEDIPGKSSGQSDVKKQGKVNSSFHDRVWNALAPWAQTNLVSKQSWKVWARCWIASFAAFVIILPDRSLTTLGNAAFFVPIASLIIPPSLPVAAFLFAMFIMLLGMCTGWGIGAAAMRAALAARDQTVLKETLLKAQQSAAGAVNPDAEFKLEIFQGAFLDTRSSVIYGVFLGVGSFVFALLRANSPKLTIVSLFGSIVLDIFCTYGPLFPVAQYTIVSSLLISVSTYTAIGLVLIIFFFPESMNHAYLNSVCGVLNSLEGYVKIQEEVLKLGAGIADADELVTKAAAMRGGIFAQLRGMAAQSALIHAEPSFGYWSSNDSKTLEAPLGIMAARFCSVQSYAKLVSRTTKHTHKPNMPRSDSLTEDDTASSNLSGHTQSDPYDTILIKQLSNHTQSSESTYSVSPEEILPILEGVTQNLRESCIKSFVAVRNVIEEVNKTRWTARKEKRRTKNEKNEKGDLIESDRSNAEVLEEAIGQLRQAIKEFENVKRHELVKPFLPVLEGSFGSECDARLRNLNSSNLPLRSLIFLSVFSAILLQSTYSLLTFCSLVQTTTTKRTRRRLWAPSRLRAFVKTIFSRGDGSGNDGVVDAEEVALGESQRPVVEQEVRVEDGRYQLDPDSRPPSNFLQKVADRIHRVYLWLKTPETSFAIKYVIVTIALWLPSVFKSSTYFVYVEKSVWALVMAQITLNVYTSEQLYNYVVRLGGTFIGLVLGLLLWYLGNAHGNGSPYGFAAVIGVFLVPMTFFRVFGPPTILIPILMIGTTVALIVGYSWIDGHLFVLGSPGIGWSVAWKRWVLVVIGSVASLIVTMFTPTSGRKAVRLQNAAIIKGLSGLYVQLMSTWIMESEYIQDDISSTYSNSDPTAPENNEENPNSSKITTKTPSITSPKWLDEFRERLLGLSQQIQGLKTQTALAKWEGNIRGAWPSEEYNRLIFIEEEMLSALAQLGGALSHLDSEWRLSLRRHTKILNPNFISDSVAIFSLVSQSLRTGEAMHQILPTALLDRLIYHNIRAHRARNHPGRRNGDGGAGDTPAGDVRMDGEGGNGSPAHLSPAEIMERVQSLQYIYFAAGIASVWQVISGLDELHIITKRLCGEVPFEGFAKWRDEYENYNLGL